MSTHKILLTILSQNISSNQKFTSAETSQPIFFSIFCRSLLIFLCSRPSVIHALSKLFKANWNSSPNHSQKTIQAINRFELYNAKTYSSVIVTTVILFQNTSACSMFKSKCRALYAKFQKLRTNVLCIIMTSQRQKSIAVLEIWYDVFNIKWKYSNLYILFS